jgi:long-chain fatty acid transport protein
MRKSDFTLALAAGMTALLGCHKAIASGFQIGLDSVPLMSRGFAGSASAPGDAGAVTNNPAAMSLFTAATVQSDAFVIDFNANFTGGGHDASGQPLTGGNGGNAGGVTLVPAFHFITPVAYGFTFGAALTAPFGLTTEYDSDWVGRYQALQSELRTFDLTLAGAYEFNRTFSVGAGLIVEREDAKLSKAVDFGAILASAGLGPLFLPQSADGMSEVKGNHTALGWEGGLLFRPGKDTIVGLRYRSKIDHDIKGTASFNVPSAVQAVFTQSGSPFFRDQSASASVPTPAIINFSITQNISDRVALSFEIGRTQWSALQKLQIDFAGPDPASIQSFNWRDSTLVALGMDWRLSDTLTFRAGLSRDQSPTNNETRDASLPDNNRMIYAFGLAWSPSRTATWTIGYLHDTFDKPTIDEVSPTGSTLAGSYDVSADVLGVSAMLTF